MYQSIIKTYNIKFVCTKQYSLKLHTARTDRPEKQNGQIHKYS